MPVNKRIISNLNPRRQPHPGLFLGVWQGTKAERTGYWLRWWDESGEMLLWGVEMVEKERQRVDRLAAQLRAAGIEPEA